MAIMAVAGLAACSSDNYDMAAVPTTEQVYFSNESASEILLEDGQSTVEIEVSRVKTEGSLTVNLTAVDTTEAKLFSIPSSVTFADGEATAKVPVTFTFSSLVADNPYALDLTLMAETCAYGDAQKQVVIKYAPWSEWAPLGWDYPADIAGMASGQFAAWEAAYAAYAAGGYENDALIVDGDLPAYTYAQYMSGTYAQPTFMRQSMLEPAKRQIMLYDWFNGVNLVIDWNTETGMFAIAKQNTGYYQSTYSEYVFVADTYTYWKDIRGDETIKPEDRPCSYDEEAGRFTFDVTYFISQGYFGTGKEYLQLPGYVQKDYNVGIVDNGAYQSTKLLGEVFSMTLGADLSKIQYAAFAGELTDEEIAAKADGMFAGDIECTTTSESGTKVVLVDDKGDYTLVVVPYDAEGNRLETMTVAFTVLPPSGEKTYTALYTGDFTYTQWFTYDDGTPYVDEGLILSQCEQDDTKFRIENWGNGTNFTFTMLANGSIQVDDQEIGDTHPNYGTVYVGDITTYTGSTKYGVSSYDKATGVLSFNTIYYCAAGKFTDPGIETFELKGKAASAAKRALAAAQAKAALKAKSAGKKLSTKRLDVVSGTSNVRVAIKKSVLDSKTVK